MAALNITQQHIADPARDGTYIILTRCIRSSAASDTVTLPEGLVACADLPDSGGTAATVTTSGTTATVTGGLAGASLRLVSLHVGNAAAL